MHAVRIVVRYEETVADLVEERRVAASRVARPWVTIALAAVAVALVSGGLSGHWPAAVPALLIGALATWLLWAIRRASTSRTIRAALERHPRRPVPETVVATFDASGLELRRLARQDGLPDRSVSRLSWRDVTRLRVRRAGVEVWCGGVLVAWCPSRALAHVSDPRRALSALQRTASPPLPPLDRRVVSLQFEPSPALTMDYLRTRWARGIEKRNNVFLRLFGLGVLAMIPWMLVDATLAPWLPAQSGPVATLLAAAVMAPVALASLARGAYERLMWPIRARWSPHLTAPVQVEIDGDYVWWSGGIGQHAHAWYATDAVTWTATQCWIRIANGAELVIPQTAFEDCAAARLELDRWLAMGHARKPLPVPTPTRSDGTTITAADPDNPFAPPAGDKLDGAAESR